MVDQLFIVLKIQLSVRKKIEKRPKVVKFNFVDNNLLLNISCCKMANHKSAKKRYTGNH